MVRTRSPGGSRREEYNIHHRRVLFPDKIMYRLCMETASRKLFGMNKFFYYKTSDIG